MPTSKDEDILVCVCMCVGGAVRLWQNTFLLLFLSSEALGNRVIDFLLRSGAWSGKALLD